MANSMLDQLKKAGLVDKNKLQKVKHDQYKNQKHHKGKPVVDESRLQVQQAQAEKAARDRALNQQRDAENARKALTAQIRQLIESNTIVDASGEIAYHFTDATKVKQIYVNAKAQQHLVGGRLAIARLDDRYVIVPAGVAAKLAERDPSYILTRNEPTAGAPEGEDPYADYKIPDDLMW